MSGIIWLKFISFLFLTMLLSSCASLTESPDCDRDRQLLAKYKIDIDKFRVKPMTEGEFIESRTKQYSGTKLVLQNSTDWNNYYGTYTGMISAIHRTCGTIDGSDPVHGGYQNAESAIVPYLKNEKLLQDASQSVQSLPDANMSESLRLLMNHEGYKYNAIDSSVLHKKIAHASSIDITKKWNHEDIYTYSSQAGVLKEDAKKARREMLHQWVLSAFDDLVYIAFFNSQLQKILSEKIPLRVDQQNAEHLCDGVTDQLTKKFNFHFAEQGGDENPSWEVRVGDYGQGTRGQDCIQAIGPFTNGESADSNNEYIRELLKDKYLRFKLAQHLLMTIVTIDATRISDDQIKLNIQIDWPTFFAKYQFKNISDLIEK